MARKDPDDAATKHKKHIHIHAVKSTLSTTALCGDSVTWWSHSSFSSIISYLLKKKTYHNNELLHSGLPPLPDYTLGSWIPLHLYLLSKISRSLMMIWKGGWFRNRFSSRYRDQVVYSTITFNHYGFLNLFPLSSFLAPVSCALLSTRHTRN